MKTLLRFFALPALALLSVTAGAPAQETAGERETFHFERFLRLKNDTAETLQVELHIRSLVGGKWGWQPVEPGKDKGLSITLEKGADLPVEVDGKPLAGSRVRLIAKGETLSFTEFRDKDLWLVPEKDGDEHRYSAASMETFTHTFKTEVIAKGDMDSPMDKGTTDTASAPPAPPPLDPAPPVVPDAPPPVTSDPPPPITDGGGGIGGGGTGGGGGIGGGACPTGPEGGGGGDIGGGDPGGMGGMGGKGNKDLAAESLKVDKTGAFQGVIANVGEGGHLIGRQWRLQQQDKAGKLVIVKKGIVPPMLPKGKTTVKGNVGPVKEGSAFVLSLTPGDANAENDKTEPVTVDGLGGGDPTDPKTDPGKGEPKVGPDLAVTELKVVGKTLTGKIVNLGPGIFKGSRTYSLGSPTKVTKNGVKNLKPGEVQTVTMSLEGIDHLKHQFVLSLSEGDGNKINDMKMLSYTPGGSGGTPGGTADLAVISAIRNGNKVTVVVRNVGTAKSNGTRTLTVSGKKVLGAGTVAKTTPVGPMNPGASQTFTVTLPIPVNQVQAFLNSIPGDNPANDRKTTP